MRIIALEKGKFKEIDVPFKKALPIAVDLKSSNISTYSSLELIFL